MRRLLASLIVVIGFITVFPVHSSADERRDIDSARVRAQQAQKNAREEQNKAIAASQKATLESSHAQGYGWINYKSGAYYWGEILNRERNGYGSFAYQDGRHEGKFSHDKPDGPGVIVAANGDRYEGEFRGGSSGLSAGYGVYSWADGRRYEGEFANDHPNGAGVLIAANGKIQAGIWKDGNLFRPVPLVTPAEAAGVPAVGVVQPESAARPPDRGLHAAAESKPSKEAGAAPGIAQVTTEPFGPNGKLFHVGGDHNEVQKAFLLSQHEWGGDMIAESGQVWVEFYRLSLQTPSEARLFNYEAWCDAYTFDDQGGHWGGDASMTISNLDGTKYKKIADKGIYTYRVVGRDLVRQQHIPSTVTPPRENCKRGKRPGGKSFGLPALVGCGRSTRADGCRFPWRGISDSIAGCRLPISIHFRLPS